MGVTSGSSVLKFSLKELEDLVNDADSQVYLKKDVKYPLKLTPACLQNVNQAITEILTAERLKYIPKYKGLLLAYKHVRRHSNMGTINDDECNIMIHIHVDLYIFAPEIGCTMMGIVSKISEDNIGCLVHKGFNVTLPRPRNEGSATWMGNNVKLGDEVKFKLDTFNVVGTLPYIRGVLLSHKVVKQASKLLDFVEDYEELPKKKQSVVKGKKLKFKEEETASESLKKPSKKKKKHAEEEVGESFTEDVLPKPVKAKKERKTSEKSGSEVAATSDASSVQKSKIDKKRKSDPIAEPSTVLGPQTSAKKRMKLSSKSTTDGSDVAGTSASGGGYKSSLLQVLMSDDEGDGEVSSQTNATKTTDDKKKRKDEKKKKKKEKKEEKDSTIENIGEMSIEALMQQALANVGGKTPKPKKSRPLRVPDEKQIPKESPKKNRPEDEVVGEPASAEKKIPAPETHLEEKFGTFAQELLKSTKKMRNAKLTDHLDSGAISKTPSELKNLERKSDLSNFVAPKPEELLAKIQVSKSPMKKLQTKPKKPLAHVETKLAENSETSVNKKKSRKSSLSESLQEDVILPKPEELLAKMLEHHTKSPKKKNTTNPIKPLTNGEKVQTPSKLADKSGVSSPKKIKAKKALTMDEDDEDFNLPTPAEILAKVQEEQRKSPKKKRKTSMSGPLDSNDVLPTTPKVVAISETVSSKKKRKSKSSLSESLLEDDTLPKPAELLANMQEEITKSPKKKKKTCPIEVSDNGEIVQTPVKLAENPESSSSKRKSKSILLGLLNDARASLPVAETPAKIRKTFVQSPIVDVAKQSKTPKVKKAPASAVRTPLPSLPPLPSLKQLSPRKEEKAGSKQGTPVKKLGMSGEGTLSLMDKLLLQEKSMQFGEDESLGLTPSSKKKTSKK